MSPSRCYDQPPPGLELSRLTGRLIVLEGPDASGRSTHLRLLSTWLEEAGHAVTAVGIKRSSLVHEELEGAMQGNVLSPRTMSLFYATDFYDQMENVVAPALRSGSVVLADRYIYTLMARDMARGANPAWVESVYSRALVPDAVFYLKVTPGNLAVRTLTSHRRLDYWESGMDMGLARDWFDSFMLYQRRIDGVFRAMGERYGFAHVNANRSIDAVQRDLRGQVDALFVAR